MPGDAFSLPVGYRPALNVQYSTIDGTGTPSGRVFVDPDGDVRVQTGNNAVISLDGISWRV